MANRKNSKKNPYTKSAKKRVLDEKTAKKRKIIKTVLICSASAVVLTAAIVLGIVFGGSKARSNKMIAKAEEYLLSSPYKLTLTSSADTTDNSIKDILNTDTTKVSVTLDGDDFKFVEYIGDAQIDRLYFDGSLYIDESIANVRSKYSIDAQRLAEERDKYVTPYISVFSAEDYKGRDIEKDDKGAVTLVLDNLTKERREALEKQMNDALGKNSGATAKIDDEVTKTTIKIDSDGRFTSIERVYGIAVTYTDGFTSLVTMTAKKAYSYGSAIKLAVPSNVNYPYIDHDGDYTNVFGGAFEVETKVTLPEDIDSTVLARLGAIGSIENSTLKVDKNNFEIVYPIADKSDDAGNIVDGSITKWTLIDNKIYIYESVLKDGTESLETSSKLYQTLGTDSRTSIFGLHVIDNVFPYPGFVRHYTDIKASTSAESVTTVICTTISEDFYNDLNAALNVAYSSGASDIRLTPDADKCKFTVKYDANGRFVSTELKVVIKPDMPADQTKVYEDIEIVIERAFDYEEADEYYQNAGDEPAPWLKAPSDLDNYKYSELFG